MRLVALCGMQGAFTLDDGRKAREVSPGAVFLADPADAAHLIARRRASPVEEPPKPKKRKAPKRRP